MKKIVLLALSLVAVFGMISCATTSTMDPAAQKQAAINKSFDQVYSSHAGDLVMDGAKNYTVKKGDTLTSITKTFYAGDDVNGYYFPIIMLASRNVVSDPELITPGMKLTIPNFEKNIKDKAVAKKMSSFFRDLTGVYRQKDTPAAADILPHLIEIADLLAKGGPTAIAESEAAETKTEKPVATESKADGTTSSKPKASNEPVVMPN
jgi:LysM repeat protein